MEAVFRASGISRFLFTRRRAMRSQAAICVVRGAASKVMAR
jgi:hypothetical protein